MQTLMVLWVALSMNAPTKRAPLVGYNLPDSQLACIKIQGYYNKIKTPTLVIHSMQDYRCWVPEAMQLFTSLQWFGVKSKMVLFHGETHELSRSGKPHHRIKRLDEITAWFDSLLA